MPADIWWLDSCEQLIEEVVTKTEHGDQSSPAPLTPVYVYSLDAIRRQLAACQSKLTSINRLWYAVKANNNPDILRTIFNSGNQIIGGFECVTIEEVRHVIECVQTKESGSSLKDRLLYTPNFASKRDFEEAFDLCRFVTLDNASPLFEWPEVFRCREIFLRLDPPGFLLNEHEHNQHKFNKTNGSLSKFGISLGDSEEINPEQLVRQLEALQCRVVGLHIHTGSQIFDPESWAKTARYMTQFCGKADSLFPHVRVINVGGGMGINYHQYTEGHEKQNEKLDLGLVNQHLAKLKADLGNDSIEFWMESGRYLVAEAGVLLTRVTQLKRKQGRSFVGCDAGMNCLIRPALYEAYHFVFNLSHAHRKRKEHHCQENEDQTVTTDVVGTICESGDIIGRDRKLPVDTRSGDVLVIAIAGAYGFVSRSLIL